MKKAKKNILPKILLVILILCIGMVGYLIWQEVERELSIQDMEKKTIEKFVTQKEEIEDNDGYSFDWAGMCATNEDVIGWIRFDEPSRINYPIVWGDDNHFYLTHDWQRNYQSAGAIFLNSHNNSEFKDANSIIYGHRMINGSMFGGLKKYASQEFMDTYPYFYIYTPDGKKRTYEIFAYAQVIDGSEPYKTRFDTAEERNTYYNNIINRAITKRDVELDEFDTTATLSTCAGKGYYDRMVLMGKLVKIEVDEQP